MHTFSFFLLITPQQKRKSPVKSLATIGGALHSLLGFLFAVSSMQEEIKVYGRADPGGPQGADLV